MFADDTQMYDHCLISNIPVLVNNLTTCINDLFLNRLQLNPMKTEFIWFGNRTTLPKILAAYRSLPAGSSVVQSCEAVRDLGVWFDSELSMKIHISRVVSICYYHLRRLRQLQHCLSQSTLIMLVTSLIVLTIVTVFWLDPRHHPSNGCKTLQPVWFSIWITGHTLLQHYNSYIGYQFTTEYSTRSLY